MASKVYLVSIWLTDSMGRARDSRPGGLNWLLHLDTTARTLQSLWNILHNPFKPQKMCSRSRSGIPQGRYPLHTFWLYWCLFRAWYAGPRGDRSSQSSSFCRRRTIIRNTWMDLEWTICCCCRGFAGIRNFACFHTWDQTNSSMSERFLFAWSSPFGLGMSDWRDV